MLTQLFGKIDCPGCENYALKKSIIDKVDLNPAVIKVIESDFNMDDFLKFHASNKYLAGITKSVISNFKNAVFYLPKFTSNSQDNIHQLLSSEIIKQSSIVQLNAEDSYRKIFGILWNIQTDVPKFVSIDNLIPTQNVEYLFYCVVYLTQ